MNSVKKFLSIIQANKSKKSGGSFSVCCTNKAVLQASIRRAKQNNSLLVIEATCNQVNQFGGYTGMKPKDFVRYIQSLCNEAKFDFSNILLGGDHLGPNVWKNEAETSALDKSLQLVEDYIRAGFRKIHLDASMPLLGDLTNNKHQENQALDNSIVSKRAALLCKKAEDTYHKNPQGEKPFYIIGTEVPVPGGSQHNQETIIPTTLKDLKETIEITKNAFLAAGLEEAWQRVVAVVVQPGLEFGDDWVWYYDKQKTRSLTEYIRTYPRLVYEAHSTDYQSAKHLRDLVSNHFCILKVGPALTFAYREALFLLAQIEKELIQSHSHFIDFVDKYMLDNPKYWEAYYKGSDLEIALKRKYSYSDRIRYYWDQAPIKQKITELLKNISKTRIPMSLIKQYFPIAYNKIAEKSIANTIESIIDSQISEVIHDYDFACKPD